MKQLIYIFLVASCLSTKATVFNCFDASRTAVQSNINLTVNGDTVNVPAGSANWTNGLSITNSISLLGAGTNLTIINYVGNNSSQCINVSCPVGATGGARISGFKLLGSSGYTFGTYYVGIELDSSPYFRTRVDNCWIEQFGMAFNCFAVGLVDDCTVVQCGRFARVQCPSPEGNWQINEQIFVRSNWYPAVLDSTNIMDFETCHGVWTNYDNIYNVLFSQQNAGSYMVRHVTFDLHFTTATPQLFDFHGNQGNITDPTNMRGGVGLNIYSNVFNCTGTSATLQFALIRAGAGLIYANTMNGSVSSADIVFYEEDANGAWSYTGPPYYDQITNFWIFANTINSSNSIHVGYNDTNTQAIYGNGVYWTNIAPSPIITLQYPHPMIGTNVPVPPPQSFTGNLITQVSTNLSNSNGWISIFTNHLTNMPSIVAFVATHPKVGFMRQLLK